MVCTWVLEYLLFLKTVFFEKAAGTAARFYYTMGEFKKFCLEIVCMSVCDRRDTALQIYTVENGTCVEVTSICCPYYNVEL